MAVAAEDDRTGIRVQSLSPRLYRQLGHQDKQESQQSTITIDAPATPTTPPQE
jgi:hypothetical protein